MESILSNYLKRFCGKRVAVVGLGISNTPLIQLLLDAGAQVIGCDKRDLAALGGKASQLQEAGVQLKLGEDYLSSIQADVIFRTPGLSYTLPELQEYRKQGVAITSEMELFFDVCPATLIGVTGSDGKTTTTTLIAEMLKAAGKTVYLGGNIGAPLLPQTDQMKPEDYAVVELSSFQLMSMRRSPDIAVVTNLSPNHLDIHKTMEEYIDAKKNILLHQNGLSRSVLNLDNDITASFASLTRGDTLFFSRKQALESGAYAAPDGTLYLSRNGQKTVVMKESDILIPGKHNVENYLAAMAAVWGIIDPETMVQVARSFAGVEHRIELVRQKDGVRWYNDSIASSPTRTIAGLLSFDQRVILIAGGYDKDIPFDALGPKIVERVKCLILMGATADKIEASVKASPGWSSDTTPILRVNNMEEAVDAAHQVAKFGDIVTLSPACASFDLYPNFAARGRHFKELVKAL